MIWLVGKAEAALILWSIVGPYWLYGLGREHERRRGRATRREDDRA